MWWWSAEWDEGGGGGMGVGGKEEDRWVEHQFFVSAVLQARL